MGGGASRGPKETPDVDYERYLKYTAGCLPEEAKARLIEDLNSGVTTEEWYALMRERYGTAMQQVIDTTVIRVQEASYRMAAAHRAEYTRRRITLQVHRNDVLYYLFMDYFISQSINQYEDFHSHNQLSSAFKGEEYLFRSNAEEALVHSTGHYEKHTWRRTRLIHELSSLLFSEPLVVTQTNQLEHTITNNMGRLHIAGVGEINTAAAVIDTFEQTINGIRIDDLAEFNKAVDLISEDQAGAKRKRSEAAKKAAETRKRNKEDKEKEEEEKPELGLEINDTTRHVIFRGTPAILKNIEPVYIPYYKIKSRHLPEVYRIDGVSVIMEVLDPFVFDEKQIPRYFDALKEVFELTKYNNMDISPSNTMMRNGEIVFIDLWTGGITPAYYMPRSDNAIVGLMQSLALVLLYYQYEKEIKQWIWNMIDDLKKEFPSSADASRYIEIDRRIYSHARGRQYENDGDLAVLRIVYPAHTRMTRLQSYLIPKNKTFKEMTWSITAFHDKEYGEYYNKIKFETSNLSTKDILKFLFERVNVNPDENAVVKQLKINNINDFVAVKEELLFEEEVAVSGFLEFKPMNMSNSALFFPSTLRKILVMKKGEDVELTFSFDPEGRLFKDTYMSAFDWDPRFLGEKATVEQQLEGLAKVVDGRVILKRTVPYSVWEANEGRWESLIRKFSTSYHGKTFEEVKAKNKRVFQK